MIFTKISFVFGVRKFIEKEIIEILFREILEMFRIKIDLKFWDFEILSRSFF